MTTAGPPTPAPGTVAWVVSDGTIRLTLTGEIDLSCRAEIVKATAVMADAMPCHVLIDVTDVTFFSSEGLALLAEAIRLTAPDNKRVTLHNPDSHTSRAVKLIGMLGQLTITP